MPCEQALIATSHRPHDTRGNFDESWLITDSLPSCCLYGVDIVHERKFVVASAKGHGEAMFTNRHTVITITKTWRRFAELSNVRSTATPSAGPDVTRPYETQNYAEQSGQHPVSARNAAGFVFSPRDSGQTSPNSVLSCYFLPASFDHQLTPFDNTRSVYRGFPGGLKLFLHSLHLLLSSSMEF